VRGRRSVGGRRLCAAIATLLALGCLPAPALATTTSSPFSPGVPQSTTATATGNTGTAITTVGTSTSSSGSGLSSGTALAIGIGAIALIGGISFYIWYDARRRAPVRAHAAAATRPNVPGSKRTKPRKLSAAEKRRRKRGRAK
jgi:hypothetical protein